MGSCCSRTNDVASAKDRLTQVALTPDDPMKVIKGYKKEPFVSLEDALRPFHHQIKDLSKQILQAKRNCRQVSEHSLTSDQASAIYLYSMNMHSNSVYHHLHRTWLSNDRSEMTRWFKYLRLFYSGINKLPDVKTNIWQGIPYDKQWEERLKSDSFPIYTYLGSCSLSLDLIKGYLNEKPPTNMILIAYENLKAKDVTGYTRADFREVFLQPGTPVMRNEHVRILPNGTMIFYFTEKSTNSFSIDDFSSGLLTPTAPTKHFVCPNKFCGQSCPRNHETRICLGSKIIRHLCSHHCGPTPHCVRCNKHNVTLRQCDNCGYQFCDDCSLK